MQVRNKYLILAVITLQVTNDEFFVLFFNIFNVSQQGAGRPGGSGLFSKHQLSSFPGNPVNLSNDQTLTQHNPINQWTF